MEDDEIKSMADLDKVEVTEVSTAGAISLFGRTGWSERFYRPRAIGGLMESCLYHCCRIGPPYPKTPYPETPNLTPDPVPEALHPNPGSPYPEAPHPDPRSYIVT